MDLRTELLAYIETLRGQNHNGRIVGDYLEWIVERYPEPERSVSIGGPLWEAVGRYVDVEMDSAWHGIFRNAMDAEVAHQPDQQKVASLEARIAELKGQCLDLVEALDQGNRDRAELRRLLDGEKARVVNARKQRDDALERAQALKAEVVVTREQRDALLPEALAFEVPPGSSSSKAEWAKVMAELAADLRERADHFGSDPTGVKLRQAAAIIERTKRIDGPEWEAISVTVKPSPERWIVVPEVVKVAIFETEIEALRFAVAHQLKSKVIDAIGSDLGF